SFTLNRGQQYSSLGSIHPCPATCPVSGITINAGTKVATTKPLGGMIFTGGTGSYADRHYALLPDLLHSTDYVITAPGATNAARPTNLYIFNPDPVNPLSVTMTYNVPPVTSTTITVPANAVSDFRNATGINVPANSTVRLTSNRNFWGVTAYDQPDLVSDWGHSWLATRFLTNNYTVPYAPGTLNPVTSSAARPAACGPPSGPATGPGVCNTLNRDAVFVAATQDNTLVRIDFNNDGKWDYIDINSDDYPDQGSTTDTNCAPPPVVGYTNCVYSLSALQSLRVWDWKDYDNTGTHVVASKPVAVSWGQDPDQGENNDPSPDEGYTIYPINQNFLDPVLTLEKTASTTSQPTTGGVVTYTLTIKSYSFGPLTSVQAYDLLPATVTTGAYVTGSTLITYPDLTQGTNDPTFSTDATTGLARLDWALSPST